jgi:hypothetical protein
MNLLSVSRVLLECCPSLITMGIDALEFGGWRPIAQVDAAYG